MWRSVAFVKATEKFTWTPHSVPTLQASVTAQSAAAKDCLYSEASEISSLTCNIWA